MRRSSRRFPPELRRLAPALVDVIADHLLACRWEQHHALPLEHFSRETYRQIHDSSEHLPAQGRRFLSWMVEVDLLASYVSWETTVRGLRSITRRLDREELNPIMESELPGLLDDLASDFDEYFPDMVIHACEWLAARTE
jgi:acyl carrier protein phosphodiesterase